MRTKHGHGMLRHMQKLQVYTPLHWHKSKNTQNSDPYLNLELEPSHGTNKKGNYGQLTQRRSSKHQSSVCAIIDVDEVFKFPTTNFIIFSFRFYDLFARWIKKIWPPANYHLTWYIIIYIDRQSSHRYGLFSFHWRSCSKVSRRTRGKRRRQLHKRCQIRWERRSID